MRVKRPNTPPHCATMFIHTALDVRMDRHGVGICSIEAKVKTRYRDGDYSPGAARGGTRTQPARSLHAARTLLCEMLLPSALVM